MTAYDPALCERLVAEARARCAEMQADRYPSVDREILHDMADQLEAARREVDLACGTIDSGNDAFRQLRDQWSAERDALRADLTQATSDRDIARSRLDMSESYGRDKDTRIAALEVGLRTACDLLDEWIECHTALDSCEDEPDWATSTRLRVLADTTKE